MHKVGTGDIDNVGLDFMNHLIVPLDAMPSGKRLSIRELARSDLSQADRHAVPVRYG
jgi:hypothetical protein